MTDSFNVFQLKPFFSILIFGFLNQSYAGWVSDSQDIMGTKVVIESWDTNDSKATQCNAKVMLNMHRIDALMSPYKPESEVSRINSLAAEQKVSVSEELYTLIQTSQHFSRLSEGAFDITFASVGHRYDYREKIRPSDALIKQTLPAVNYQNLILDQNSVQFAHPGMEIDLGGIAKGYAVDQGINILKQCGIKNAIISAGGDSRILGDKNGRPWMIGIQHPRQSMKIALSIPLSDIAISTSGDYERYFLSQNERIHHIINPSTGKSASKSWSASVIGPNATTTDALSTTLFILGAEKGLRLINSLPEIDAIIIDKFGKVHYSSGLENPRAEEGNG